MRPRLEISKTFFSRKDEGTKLSKPAYQHMEGFSPMLLLALSFHTGATGWERFAVFSVVAFVVFTFVLRVALRKRDSSLWSKILATGVFVVFGGMLFARWTYGPSVPWWIFYGLPALATFLVPPIMFRMSRLETIRYIAMAVLMAPAIHVFFSFFVGWHDYMPLFYVRSIWEVMQGPLQ
jgi:hypothetical protein